MSQMSYLRVHSVPMQHGQHQPQQQQQQQPQTQQQPQAQQSADFNYATQVNI